MFALFGLLVTVLIFANVFYYMKNANLRAQRNSEEVMLVKRIYNFVERIEGREEIIEPAADEYTTAETSVMNDLDPAFVKAINKVKMIVMTERRKKKMNMRRLSNAAGLDPKRFYQLVMDNIFKSPRTLIKEARVEEAEKMLRNTKASIEEISKECGFVSANYFIASVFQKYKVTPQAYRDKR
jgi:AraC-like DNA-binding protein